MTISNDNPSWQSLMTIYHNEPNQWNWSTFHDKDDKKYEISATTTTEKKPRTRDDDDNSSKKD